MILIPLFIGLTRCNEIKDCQLDSNSDLVVVVFSDLNDQGLIFSFDSIKLSEPEQVVFGTDTITGLLLPLDLNTNEVEYTFYTDTTDYILQLTYNTEITLYDSQCEPSYRFYALDAQSEQFDSIRVVSDLLNTKILLNLEIYF